MLILKYSIHVLLQQLDLWRVDCVASESVLVVVSEQLLALVRQQPSRLSQSKHVKWHSWRCWTRIGLIMYDRVLAIAARGVR